MALKTITFTVGSDGALSPAVVQDAGVQGDHRVTELVFEFSDGLYTYLQEKGAEGALVYRFDGYDGEGEVHHSDTAVLCEREVVYPLEYSLTEHGGLVKVELIITLVKGEESAEVLHTHAAQLKLIFSPYSTGDKAQTYSDVSALAQIAKECAERAEKAERAAAEARAQTALLAAAFQNGTTYIFNGGNASGQIETDYIIDNEMSDYSHNAVKNKSIKAYVDGKFPVGSVWIGGKDANGTPIYPSDIFGGTWRLIDKSFRNENVEITFDRYIIDGNELKADGYETTANALYMDKMTVNCHRAGNTVRFRISCYLKPETDYNDGGVSDFMRLYFREFGFTGLRFGFYGMACFNDSLDSVGLLMAVSADGQIGQRDIIGAERKLTIPKDYNGELNIDFTTPILTGNMLDEFCDKFYWEKTDD